MALNGGLNLQGKPRLKPDWRTASPERARFWLMYKKVDAPPKLALKLSSPLTFLLCKHPTLS